MKSLLFTTSITLLFSSCDAMLFMSYSVENASEKDVEVFVPNYTFQLSARYRAEKDTILLISKGESVIVGTESTIDFPWARKNIYRKRPGICGIQQVTEDTTILFGCTQSEWKYKRGTSILKIN